MSKARLVAAILLALPLLLFGAGYFLPFEPSGEPPVANPAGLEFLESMRKGGLMAPVAASHVLVGLLLLVSRTRFLAALLQLPMSLGILAFHLSMMPEGNAVAFAMLALNLVVLADRSRFRRLLD